MKFSRMLKAAPEHITRTTDAGNMGAKVEMFHRQWRLPVDITALPFFIMPGDVTSEVKQLNGALIADLVNKQIAGEPVIRRIIEPMSGSGFYSNFVRAAGFKGELRVNDLNPLVSWTQEQIVAQPDRVKHYIQRVKKNLVHFATVRGIANFDPHTLKAHFPSWEAAKAFVVSPKVKDFRDELRRYFYTTVEGQYIVRDGRIVITPDASFGGDHYALRPKRAPTLRRRFLSCKTIRRGIVR